MQPFRGLPEAPAAGVRRSTAGCRRRSMVSAASSWGGARVRRSGCLGRPGAEGRQGRPYDAHRRPGPARRVPRASHAPRRRAATRLGAAKAAWRRGRPVRASRPVAQDGLRRATPAASGDLPAAGRRPGVLAVDGQQRQRPWARRRAARGRGAGVVLRVNRSARLSGSGRRGRPRPLPAVEEPARRCVALDGGRAAVGPVARSARRPGPCSGKPPCGQAWCTRR